ncbi:hypothetical protein BC833DRAFT_331454 [Globomyces pollinis-pini]|nr:hypothetical protein BC833DRAFT_331454 [Globomyces pollinis-pini]
MSNCLVEDKVVLIASNMLIELSQGKQNVNGINWNEKLNLIITTVAQSRFNGIYQSELGKKCNLDGKSIFHYIKILKPLIVKVPVSITRTENAIGHHSNLIILKRFCEYSESYKLYLKKLSDIEKIDNTSTIFELAQSHETIHIRLSSSQLMSKLDTLLTQAKNNILYIEDLMGALQIERDKKYSRKYFFRVLHYLKTLGVIEHVNIPKSSVDGKKGNGVVGCVRKINSFDAAMKHNFSQAIDPERDILSKQDGLMIDYTLEYQVFKLILSAGDAGILLSTIITAFPFVGDRNIRRTLDVLSGDLDLRTKQKKSGISCLRKYIQSSFELTGRIRHLRYKISKVGLEYSNMIKPHPELRDTSTGKKPSKCEIVHLHTDSASLAELPIADRVTSQICSDIDDDMIPDIGPTNAALNSNFSSGDYVSVRKALILETVQAHRVIEFGSDLTKELRELAAKKKIIGLLKHIPNSRYLWNLVEQLVNQELLKIENVNVELLTGLIVSKTLLVDISVSDIHPLVSDYCENLKKTSWFPKSYPKPCMDDSVKVERLEFDGTKPDVVKDEHELCQFVSWQSIAVSNGYILPKIRRSKIFLSWLFTLSNSFIAVEASSCLIIDIRTLFAELPLGIYFSIIGVLKNSELRDQYLKETPDAGQTKLVDLPNEIKVVTIDQYRFKMTLYELANILNLLGLVEAVENVDGIYKERDVSFLGSTIFHLRLKRDVSLKDYYTSPPRIIEYFTFDSPTVMELYWKKLESFCIGSDRRKYVNVKKEFQILFNSRNWNHYDTFSAEEKDMLYSFVDKERFATPFNNDNFLQSLSTRLSVSVARIKTFYRRIEYKFAKTHRKQVDSTAGTKKITDSRPETAVRHRQRWIAEYDRPLLLGYSILSNYPVRSHFPLYALKFAFPDTKFSNSGLRRRIRLLKNCSRNIKLLSALKSLWLEFESWRIQNSLQAERFTIGSMLLDFPALINEFDKYCTEKNQFAISGVSYFKSNLTQKIHLDLDTFNSRKIKLRYLTSLSLVSELNRSLADFHDVEFDENNLMTEIVSAALKMIFLNQKDSCKLATSIITVYPSDVINDVIVKMNKLGLISPNTDQSSKASVYWNYQLSSKFRHTLSGYLSPKIFLQAFKYHSIFMDQLNNTSKCDLSSKKVSGVMAVILDAINEPNIQCVALVGESSDEIVCPRVEFRTSTRNWVSLEQNQPKRHKIGYLLESMETDSVPKSYSNSLNRDILELIYKMLSDSKKLGCSIMEIMRTVGQQESSSFVMKHITSLIEDDKVVEVGFSHHRYVLKKYQIYWCFQNREENSDSSTKGIVEYSSTSLDLKIWNDVYGRKMDHIYKACLAMVLGFIVKSPGIFESNLYCSVMGVTNRVELTVLLDDLVKRKAISCKRYAINAEVNGLLDHLFVSDNEPLIELKLDTPRSSESISSYTTLPNWYLKFSE